MFGYFKRMPELYDSGYYLAVLQEKARRIKDLCRLNMLYAQKNLEKDTFTKKHSA